MVFLVVRYTSDSSSFQHNTVTSANELNQIVGGWELTEASRTKQPHVLFVSIPWRGHVNPLRAIGITRHQHCYCTL
jgi:hypothetical protein